MTDTHPTHTLTVSHIQSQPNSPSVTLLASHNHSQSHYYARAATVNCAYNQSHAYPFCSFSTMVGNARVAVFTEAGQPLSLLHLPLPTEVKEGQLLCRILLAGICGTDLHTVSGRRNEATPRYVLIWLHNLFIVLCLNTFLTFYLHIKCTLVYHVPTWCTCDPLVITKARLPMYHIENSLFSAKPF